MSETRKIAAILVADVVGYSRLAGVDEDRTLSRLRGLRSDLIDPAIAAASWTHRQAHRRWKPDRVSQCSRRDALRDRSANRHGRAQRRRAERTPHRIPRRSPFGRRGRRGRRRSDGRRGQRRGAARLESIAKPGAICLSEQAYWQVKGRLDLAVSDLGPTQLKNIAEPIRVYSLEIGAAAKPMPAPMPEKSAPPRLSIVALPFANIGGDPSHEHFVDGVTESLTTDLSRIRGSFVIGRNTAFTYKGKAVDLKQIGRELNVRYVLEGVVVQTF
jgi:adenylate cyclase